MLNSPLALTSEMARAHLNERPLPSNGNEALDGDKGRKAVPL